MVSRNSRDAIGVGTVSGGGGPETTTTYNSLVAEDIAGRKPSNGWMELSNVELFRAHRFFVTD